MSDCDWNFSGVLNNAPELSQEHACSPGGRKAARGCMVRVPWIIKLLDKVGRCVCQEPAAGRDAAFAKARAMSEAGSLAYVIDPSGGITCFRLRCEIKNWRQGVLL
jgi:hypothetical protein